MKIDSQHLGEFYRELRIARGFKQKDIANDILSVSQLSKFENGQSMLSADKLIVAIEGIHMTFAEFGHQLYNQENPHSIQISRKIAQLFIEKDIDGLEKLLAQQLNKEKSDLYNTLEVFVIENVIHRLDSTYEIAEEDKQTLTEYLYNIDSWTWFELYLGSVKYLV